MKPARDVNCALLNRGTYGFSILKGFVPQLRLFCISAEALQVSRCKFTFYSLWSQFDFQSIDVKNNG